MKIFVDNEFLFEISEIERKVICSDIDIDEFDEDIKRRLHYIISSKYQACFKRLKSEWDTKFTALGIKMIPTDEKEYAKLVFSQSDYKDRKTREPKNPKDKYDEITTVNSRKTI